jgi:hypothetical protein
MGGNIFVLSPHPHETPKHPNEEKTKLLRISLACLSDHAQERFHQPSYHQGPGSAPRISYGGFYSAVKVDFVHIRPTV